MQAAARQELVGGPGVSSPGQGAATHNLSGSVGVAPGDAVSGLAAATGRLVMGGHEGEVERQRMAIASLVQDVQVWSGGEKGGGGRIEGGREVGAGRDRGR